MPAPRELALLFLIAVVSFGLSFVGAAIGMVLGHLRVVLLVYLLGPASGVATSMLVSTAGTLAGAGRHALAGRISLRVLLSVGVPSAIASYFASKAAMTINPRFLKATIALVLVVSGVQLLRPKLEAAPSNESSAQDKRTSTVRETAAEVLLGTALGAIAGFVGLLLGTLRLPAMMSVSRERHDALVGTNMAIGAITGVASAYAIVTTSASRISVMALIALVPGTMLGALLGAAMTARLNKRALERAIGAGLVFSAVMMAVEIGVR